jgi:hypothetical protein
MSDLIVIGKSDIFSKERKITQHNKYQHRHESKSAAPIVVQKRVIEFSDTLLKAVAQKHHETTLT